MKESGKNVKKVTKAICKTMAGINVSANCTLFLGQPKMPKELLNKRK